MNRVLTGLLNLASHPTGLVWLGQEQRSKYPAGQMQESNEAKGSTDQGELANLAGANAMQDDYEPG